MFSHPALVFQPIFIDEVSLQVVFRINVNNLLE